MFAGWIYYSKRFFGTKVIRLYLVVEIELFGSALSMTVEVILRSLI
jgi:hypothetical protein